MPESAVDYGARPADAALYLPNTDPRLTRIPVVNTIYPRWMFILCVTVDDGIWGGLMPTLDELQLIRRYLDYRLEWYNNWYRRQLELRPYDIDDGVNTLTLLKRAEGEWRYRMLTWTRGPILFPSLDSDSMTLAGILNHRESLTDRWKQWQAEHPA